MPITFKRAGQEAVTLENVSFKGVALDKVTFKRAGHEAVTVFETAANGYTVSGFYHVRGSDTCFYSLDNGSTWISFRTLTFDSSNHFTIPNVKTIKFKAEDDGDYYGSISSTQLNFDLYSGYNESAKYSENFTLTQNITDLNVNSGAD